ncbi:hypothetical protein CSA37_13075 [Candidatus Fermentibacteria bacterium]|nr:MAG: hypothetical protein CSA37_13075 [Candidatus Fermentibacteria bacterium]
MTLIGIDYGRKRTGMAVYLSGIVLPLDPVLGSRELILKRLSELQERYEAIELVLGLPLTALGKHTELSREVESFAAILDENGYTVHFERETGSSKEAARLVGRKDRKGRADSVAACEILKRYLGIL